MAVMGVEETMDMNSEGNSSLWASQYVRQYGMRTLADQEAP